MGSSDSRRRLIVNADDFGRSPAANEAVIRAHGEGILTTASLMVNETAFSRAVELAHENPRLGVGLHLTLVCGRSALGADAFPRLVNRNGEFTSHAVLAGLRYFLFPSLRGLLRREIERQFDLFQSTGLVLDHVNGHLNLHLHPTILGLVRKVALERKARHVRLTRDPFWLNARLARGNWTYRISHALIFTFLAHYARPGLAKSGLRHTNAVFGLLQNSRVNEEYLLRLLPRLPPGDSELYSHPSLEDSPHELDALLSERLKALVRHESIELIRYQDL